MEQNDSPVVAGSPEPPRGAVELHLDEKTRLKLPAAFQRYVAGLGDKFVFITTITGKVAQIYPLSVWRKNEALIAQFTDDVKARDAVAFMAQRNGGDSDIDSSGRVVLPERVRELLGLQPKATVWLVCESRKFSLYSDEMYRQMEAQRLANIEADLERMKSAGFI